MFSHYNLHACVSITKDGDKNTVNKMGSKNIIICISSSLITHLFDIINLVFRHVC